VQPGTERVLDVLSVDPGAFSVPAGVHLTAGSMELRFLDSEWLQNQVKQSSLAHSLIEGHLVITARPAQVQTFQQNVGLKEEALVKPIQLTRLVPESAHQRPESLGITGAPDQPTHPLTWVQYQ